MALDLKKVYREQYSAKSTPSILVVPPINYLAVSGQGDPNEPDGAYQQAVQSLYAVAYTLRMSDRTDHNIAGYFPYVVPPLEGFWWQDHVHGVDYERRADFRWLSVLRLPDFVTKKDWAWAVDSAKAKKKGHLAPVQFLTVEEGLCVQALHIGPYTEEPKTVRHMHEFLKANGHAPDLCDTRRHHEIYLSDFRKVDPQRLKTIIRHPIRRL